MRSTQEKDGYNRGRKKLCYRRTEINVGDINKKDLKYNTKRINY